MSAQWTVEAIDTFRLSFECLAECERVFTMTMVGSTAAANQGRNAPPPNTNGWANGYCPEHAATPQQVTSKRIKKPNME